MKSKFKFKFKLNSGKIILCAIIIFFILVVRSARKDLKLDVDLLRASLSKIPTLIMENIQISREISGDLWSVKIPYMGQEHGNYAFMRSLDIKRKIAGDAGEWEFFGREGIYSHDEKAAEASDLIGKMEERDQKWMLNTPKVYWKDGKEELIFPDGLKIYNDEITVETPFASVDKNGVILLRRGGIIKWQNTK